MNDKELSEWEKLIKKYEEFIFPVVREGQKKKAYQQVIIIKQRNKKL